MAKYYQELAYRLLPEAEKAGANRALAYLCGEALADYLHDMHIVQQFAALSRQAMTDEILRAMKVDAEDSFTTIHNYIDTETMILRKGAVSADLGEQLLIPINMRDGSLHLVQHQINLIATILLSTSNLISRMIDRHNALLPN